MNDSAEIKLSRCRHALMAGGIWVLIFMIWSILRSISYYVIDPSSFSYLFEEDTGLFIKVLSLIPLLLIAYIDFSLRISISVNAFAVARGEKRSSKYIRKAVFLSACSVLGFLLFLIPNPDGNLTIELPSLLLEISSLAALCEVIVSSGRIRKLESAKENADAA